MNPFLTGVALGVGCAFLHGCSLDANYKMDANERCVMQHVWDTTANGGDATMHCPGWFLERRRLDSEQTRKAVRK